MSHVAVSWALEQKDLKPGVWIVLIKLADRQNKDTLQINPSQEKLAADCNMSRATLNRHLDELEALGLVRRILRRDPATNRSLSTYYILAKDFDNPPEVEFAVSHNETRAGAAAEADAEAGRVSNCDTEAVSQNRAEPCLKIGESRVSNCDTNLVREPLREPLRAGAREGVGFDPSDPDQPVAPDPDDRDAAFAEFWSAYPDPVEREATKRAWDRVLDEGEVEPAGLVAAAKVYAGSRQVERGFGMKPANWLSRGSWREEWEAGRAAKLAALGKPVDEAALARQFAPAVKAGRAWTASAVRPTLARTMLSLGLVAEDDLRKCGVVF